MNDVQKMQAEMQDMTKESIATFIVMPMLVAAIFSGSFIFGLVSGFAMMTVFIRLLRGVIHNAKVEKKYLNEGL